MVIFLNKRIVFWYLGFSLWIVVSEKVSKGGTKGYWEVRIGGLLEGK